ncbi:MAG TPA: hypothetical protein VNL15_00715, partial [Dehalococcoidia bacterium]|nr:hypothetical protein [Dehalococcoidia bacterium]
TAAALELLKQDFSSPASNDFASVRAAAEAAAYQWAAYNGVPEDDIHDLLVDDTDCLGPSAFLDTVYLAAEHHTKPLFVSIFKLSVPQIGAPAKACIGSLVEKSGLLPVAIQVDGVESDCWEDQYTPLFGAECVLTFGAGDQTSGEAGRVRLYNDGSFNCSNPNTGGNNQFLEEVENGGANTTCHVYQGPSCDADPGGCVWPLTGVGSKPEMDAFNELLSSEGECDSKYGSDANDIDDFLEVVHAIDGDPTPSPGTTFALNDCWSPRLVDLIIVQQFSAQGNPPLPIWAFASFYIKGCEVVDQNGNTQYSAKCDPKDFQGQIGQTRLRGFFVNLLADEYGAVGPINAWTPKRVVLVE